DTEHRSNLRHTDGMHPEIAEHLIRLPRDGMTHDAPGLSEKKRCALLLRHAHRSALPTREPIDGRIGKNQCKLEFCNGPSEHGEIDRPTSGPPKMGEAAGPPAGTRGETLHNALLVWGAPCPPLRAAPRSRPWAAPARRGGGPPRPFAAANGTKWGANSPRRARESGNLH